jgi:alkylated DNA nucleotide flippase Atl1
VPCHRVVGDDRSLTGFGLGLWRKRWLLAHEGAWPLKDGTPEGPRHHGQRTLDVIPTRGHAGGHTPA